MVDDIGSEPVTFEQEYFPEFSGEDLSDIRVEKAEEGIFTVEGERIEKMLGYTNLDSEKGFLFFQRFLKEQGILEQLEQAGIQEGDTVRVCELEFDYYQ